MITFSKELGKDDKRENTSIQLVSSGPNNEREQIKLSFIKLITAAKKQVWIQTPYLVPDESVIAALKLPLLLA